MREDGTRHNRMRGESERNKLGRSDAKAVKADRAATTYMARERVQAATVSNSKIKVDETLT